jgi:plasmid stability protein
MPNITIRLDESILHRARIWAAIHNTTVTEAVREFLLFVTTRSIDSLEPQKTLPAGLMEEFDEVFDSHSRRRFIERN